MPRPISPETQYRDSILLALLALDEVPREMRETRGDTSGRRHRHSRPRG